MEEIAIGLSWNDCQWVVWGVCSFRGCVTGLQDRCESVLTLLANTSCVMEDFIHANQTPADRPGQKPTPAKQKLVTLHAAHVLSMDAMMTTGLEIGSHSADCWKQVFRLISQSLLHKIFQK